MRTGLIVLIVIFLHIQANAQNAEGKILDEAGMPIEGAYIANLRSGTHAHANESGFFILMNTITGDTIKVSHVSYQSRTVVYTGGTEINEIHLIKSDFHLSEVVVSSNANHLNIISAIDILLSA